MRPCKGAHPQPVPDTCYLCWLCENVRHYQRKWGLPETGVYEEIPKNRSSSNRMLIHKGNGEDMRLRRYTLPCIHEGAILEWCHTCNGENRHVRECDIYDKCTRGFVSSSVKACTNCAKEQNTSYRNEHTQNEHTTVINQEQSVDSTQPSRRKLLLRKGRDEARVKSIADQQTQQNIDSVVKHRRMKSILSVSKLKPNETNWAVGITTVPERKNTTLPRTIQSLIMTGFNIDRLFIDFKPRRLGDETKPDDYQYIVSLSQEYEDYGIPCTFRTPNIRAFSNWFLGLSELYLRFPNANRYVLFQDDVIACAGVREYLEHCEYPNKGYINLMTFPQNEKEKHAYFPGISLDKMVGWYPSNQKGKSACGYVFDRTTALEVLNSEELLNRVREDKGHHNIDAAVSGALKRKGFTEYVHTPSLLKHIGYETSIHTPDERGHNTHPKEQPDVLTFKGEDWDVMSVVRGIV